MLTCDQPQNTSFEVFPRCIGDKLLFFQTSKGITIEINNLDISIIINNDRIVNKNTLDDLPGLVQQNKH